MSLSICKVMVIEGSTDTEQSKSRPIANSKFLNNTKILHYIHTLNLTLTINLLNVHSIQIV